MNDLELLEALGVESKPKKQVKLTPKEERVIAGFEEINNFLEKLRGVAKHGESRDIFERLYAVRLDKLRSSEEYKKLLNPFDLMDILSSEERLSNDVSDTMDDNELLSKLGIEVEGSSDITNLTHVKTRAEINAAEKIARHAPCQDYERFKPLFDQVQNDLHTGTRKTSEFKNNASINQGEFFILSGQKIYVADMGDKYINKYYRPDRRLRVIYDNGTESDILYRSLQRALTKDSYGNKGRRIILQDAKLLFSGENNNDDDIESGTIYVLRSKSDNPELKKRYEVLHKIGVTGGDIEKRISNAKNDPTFLMDEVEIVATYKLSNINRMKLEGLLHTFFESAQLNIEIIDRFGKPINPREWFLVPLFVIDKAVEKIKNGTIINFSYSAVSGKIISTT